MAKVITTIAAENGMDFESILSFKTDSYIGIWDDRSNCFLVVAESDLLFAPIYLEPCESLQELDDMVFEECDEHILYVFDSGAYKFSLT